MYFRFQFLLIVVSAETFTGSEFQEGSSASWWSDTWAQTLYDSIDSTTPEVFDLYFTGNENSKNPMGLDRAGVSIERQLNDFRKDMLRRRDRCKGIDSEVLCLIINCFLKCAY